MTKTSQRRRKSDLKNNQGLEVPLNEAAQTDHNPAIPARCASLGLACVRLWQREEGQDLIEYALVAALVGLGAVASMHGLATRIGTAFNSIGTSLTSTV